MCWFDTSEIPSYLKSGTVHKLKMKTEIPNMIRSRSLAKSNQITIRGCVFLCNISTMAVKRNHQIIIPVNMPIMIHIPEQEF